MSATAAASETTEKQLEAQLEAGKSTALLIALADRAVLRITGADRATWLNGVVTCDIAKMKTGDAAYGLAVTQKGRILADFYVIYVQDALIVALPGDQISGVHEAFEKYLVMEDCELAEEPNSKVWNVVGPKAAEILEAARAQGAAGGLLAPLVDGKSHVAVISATEEVAAEVETALGDALAKAGGVVGDEQAREIFRQELAVPRFGFDFDGTTYPQEAGLEKRAVAFDKGCYLGQEVVCMLELRGHVKRKLVSLAVESGVLPRKGDAVTNAAGEKVGEVTSAALSPSLGVLALAMVKAAHTENGTELKVAEAKARVRAAV
ncbi:MAG: glycine cleavage T C-terminal barrel domain-containing protein [Polyangiaceae bacterium]